MQKKTSPLNSITVFLLYTAVFAAMTFPLAVRFYSAMPGNGGDEYLMVWFFWEFYRSVFTLHAWPYFTHAVYYPHGVPLYITTSMPVNSAAASVIRILGGNEFLAFNIIFFLSSILNGYFAYLLAYESTESAPASFIAGFIFAFSPILTEQARWGDLNIWSAYGIPMFILFFNRLFKDPSVKNSAFAALGLFLATYAGFYEYTAMLLAYSLFFIIYKTAGKYTILKKEGKGSKDAAVKIFFEYFAHKRSYAKSLLLTAGFFAASASFFLFPSLYYIYFKSGIVNYNPSLRWTEGFSSTVSAFFLPPFFDKIMLPLTLALYMNPFYKINFRGANSQDFLGYVPLIFFAAAVFYLFKKNGTVRFYVCAFFLFAAVSLSPMIHIVNNIRVFDPFVYVLDVLPVFKDIEESGRYMIPGFLFFGIVCAFGIKLFLEKINRKYLFVAVILIFAGTAAGYSAYPFDTVMHRVPAWAYALKKDASKGAVMYNPPLIDWGYPMFVQTVYEKPMAGGFVIRFGFHNLYRRYLPERFYDLKGMHYRGNGINQIVLSRLGNPEDFKKNLKYFKKLGIRYIVICKGCLKGEYGWSKKHTSDVLKKINGEYSAGGNGILSIIYEDKSTIVAKFNY